MKDYTDLQLCAMAFFGSIAIIGYVYGFLVGGGWLIGVCSKINLTGDKEQ